MKPILILLISLVISIPLAAQDVTGQWNGVLKVQNFQLRVIFNVAQADNGYSATMDSPDQGAKGIPVTHTTFENHIIKFEIVQAGIEYIGTLIEDKITGTFKQNGMEFPLDLSRQMLEEEIVKRPQEPSKPYSYSIEEVRFENREANLTLAGTLSLPEKDGVFPVVILISGSGPQNRDEEILGHKPFLVISDYLTRNGIAVLRFDDRGIGQSEGDFNAATTADFATDVESAIAYLKTRKEINKAHIGLVGHSEGGIIAPMVASKSVDVSFVVLLAGTGIRGDKLLLLQQASIGKASGVAEAEIDKALETNAKLFDLVVNSKDDGSLKAILTEVLNETLENDTSIKIPDGTTQANFVAMQVDQISSPWMQYFLKHDPAISLENLSCPILALNGEKDLQVPPKVNLSAIEKALKRGGNENVTVIEFPGLNHLFQEAETGLPMEYASIEQTFSPIVLEEIVKWIKLQIK